MKTSVPFIRVALKIFMLTIAVWPLFFCKKEKNCMNTDKDQKKNNQQQTDQPAKDQQEKQHSSAFRESSRGDEKSTTNIEEEAGLEQERKEAMTERD